MSIQQGLTLRVRVHTNSINVTLKALYIHKVYFKAKAYASWIHGPFGSSFDLFSLGHARVNSWAFGKDMQEVSRKHIDHTLYTALYTQKLLHIGWYDEVFISTNTSITPSTLLFTPKSCCTSDGTMGFSISTNDTITSPASTAIITPTHPETSPHIGASRPAAQDQKGRQKDKYQQRHHHRKHDGCNLVIAISFMHEIVIQLLHQTSWHHNHLRLRHHDSSVTFTYTATIKAAAKQNPRQRVPYT